LVVQRADEVREVGAVALHLGHRVQLRAAGHARYVDQLGASLVGPGCRPLLQFHDHIGRLTGVRMGAREHDVGALRGQRQVVLDEHLHPGQTGIDQVPGEYRQAAPPGFPLCGAGTVPGPDEHLLQQLFNERVGAGHGDNIRRRGTQQRHEQNSQAARMDSCGWGRVLSRSTNGRRKPVGPRYQGSASGQGGPGAVSRPAGSSASSSMIACS